MTKALSPLNRSLSLEIIYEQLVCVRRRSIGYVLGEFGDAGQTYESRAGVGQGDEDEESVTGEGGRVEGADLGGLKH